MFAKKVELLCNNRHFEEICKKTEKNAIIQFQIANFNNLY